MLSLVYEPLLDMIINCLLAINVIVIFQNFKTYKIIPITILTITLLISIYNSSIGRWESRVKSAAPLSASLINELSDPIYRNKIIYSNFTDNYALPGIIHTHLIFYPANRLFNNWARPELIDYYICSNFAGNSNNCQEIKNLLSEELINVEYEDSSGSILKLR